MKKLIGYCRVSTDNQKEEGTIEIQEHALREHAEAKGYNLVTIFRDNGVSGGLENRPGLVELFSYLESNKETDGVLIYKLDRLARDLYIQEHLIKKLELLQRSILSVQVPNLHSNDPMRKAFRQFMGIVSELEKAWKGGFAGGSVPFGYSSEDKSLKIDDVAIKVVREIFHLKRYNRMGLREIARHLNENNVPTARGGKWHAGTVRYILKNELYKGRVIYKEVSSDRQDLRII